MKETANALQSGSSSSSGTEFNGIKRKAFTYKFTRTHAIMEIKREDERTERVREMHSKD